MPSAMKKGCSLLEAFRMTSMPCLAFAVSYIASSLPAAVFSFQHIVMLLPWHGAPLHASCIPAAR